VSTLFFVPVIYAGVHQRLAQRKARRGTPPASHEAAGTVPQES
jgi:hypothetical protein